MARNKYALMNGMTGVSGIETAPDGIVLIKVVWWSWFYPTRVRRIRRMAHFLSRGEVKWRLKPVWE
jgi:hypothetical protein